MLDLYTQAVDAINADPEFQAESLKVTNGARLNAGSDTEAAIKAALSPSDEVKTYLRTLLAERLRLRASVYERSIYAGAMFYAVISLYAPDQRFIYFQF